MVSHLFLSQLKMYYLFVPVARGNTGRTQQHAAPHGCLGGRVRQSLNKGFTKPLTLISPHRQFDE